MPDLGIDTQPRKMCRNTSCRCLAAGKGGSECVVHRVSLAAVYRNVHQLPCTLVVIWAFAKHDEAHIKWMHARLVSSRVRAPLLR